MFIFVKLKIKKMGFITKFIKSVFNCETHEKPINQLLTMETKKTKQTPEFGINPNQVDTIKSHSIKSIRVKKHLFIYGEIDSWTAIEYYGATRLSAIIFNLRKAGYNIVSIPCSALDRNSDVCNYTTYKLLK